MLSAHSGLWRPVFGPPDKDPTPDGTGGLSDFRMPNDGNGVGRKEWLALFPGRHKEPVAFSESPEVASFDPIAPLVGMTSSCPVPDVVKQLRIDPFVDLRGDTVPV